MKNEPVVLDDYAKRAPDICAPGMQCWKSALTEVVTCYASLNNCERADLDGNGGERIVFFPDAGLVVQVADEQFCIAEPMVLILGVDVRAASFSGSGRVLVVAPRNPSAQGESKPSTQRGIRRFTLREATRDDSNFRVFRSDRLMLNVLKARPVPRDTAQMSPHAHADFAQISFVLEGRYVHHLRWPWTKDLAQWREDQHIVAESPSVLEIPPTVTHTSQNIDGPGWLIDIFHPPREDFLATEGLVVNAADYPIAGNHAS